MEQTHPSIDVFTASRGWAEKTLSGSARGRIPHDFPEITEDSTDKRRQRRLVFAFFF